LLDDYPKECAVGRRHRSERLGAVSAPNEKEARAKAIKLFEIEPARSNRIHCHQMAHFRLSFSGQAGADASVRVISNRDAD
jgi:hypothetical protein